MRARAGAGVADFEGTVRALCVCVCVRARVGVSLRARVHARMRAYRVTMPRPAVCAMRSIAARSWCRTA